jgi:hypothetical protein
MGTADRDGRGRDGARRGDLEVDCLTSCAIVLPITASWSKSDDVRLVAEVRGADRPQGTCFSGG